MNIQYITDKNFARYILKYIAKKELWHIFNIYENNLLREHVHAQKLSLMKLMFLLLGCQICNFSVTVKFLTTEPLLTKIQIILPIYIIDKDDENSYYDDTI